MRHKNIQWDLVTSIDGTVPNQHVTWALAMDVRDELQGLVNCRACKRYYRAVWK